MLESKQIDDVVDVGHLGEEVRTILQWFEVDAEGIGDVAEDLHLVFVMKKFENILNMFGTRSSDEDVINPEGDDCPICMKVQSGFVRTRFESDRDEVFVDDVVPCSSSIGCSIECFVQDNRVAVLSKSISHDRISTFGYMGEDEMVKFSVKICIRHIGVGDFPSFLNSDGDEEANRLKFGAG